MMTYVRIVCVVALTFLGACANAPPARYITLDDGRLPAARSSITPVIAVVRANVPDLIDRPQLVLRSEGNQVILSEHYRWAEPLRREIPRLIANDLGELFDSSRVVAMTADNVGFPVDFRLMLDFQRLDAVVGKGADVDVLWRVEHCCGRPIVGRSIFRQPQEGGGETGHVALVAAQRQALRRVAVEIGREIAANLKP